MVGEIWLTGGTPDEDGAPLAGPKAASAGTPRPRRHSWSVRLGVVRNAQRLQAPHGASGVAGPDGGRRGGGVPVTGRTGRKWSGAWIPKLVFDEVVHGDPGYQGLPDALLTPLLEIVHWRINVAMRRRGCRWLRHLWVTEEEWARAGRKKEKEVKEDEEVEG